MSGGGRIEQRFVVSVCLWWSKQNTLSLGVGLNIKQRTLRQIFFHKTKTRKDEVRESLTDGRAAANSVLCSVGLIGLPS